MKKTLYILLLVVEGLADLVALGLMLGWESYFLLLGVVATLAVLLTLLCISHRKARQQGDAKKLKRCRLLIALTLLLPIAVSMGIMIATLISLILYF